MPVDPALRYTEEDCHALFRELFPGGWAGEDVRLELAPDGWERSPLVAVFHPSAEQVLEEAVAMQENLDRFVATRKAAKSTQEGEPVKQPPPRPVPTLDELRAEQESRSIQPERELRELVGMCLWDLFSDNHEVLGPDVRVVDLGSFRASGGFLAEVANRELGHPEGSADERELKWFQQMAAGRSVEEIVQSMAEEKLDEARSYGYMDFYLGTRMIAGRADLSPAYQLIFRRLQSLGCDWRYHFPRLLLVDLRPLRDALKEQEDDEPAWEEYDPSAAFAEQHEDQERDEELARMRADMDDSHREAVAAAREGPPPATVAAYRDVFGQFPEGWPPEVEG